MVTERFRPDRLPVVEESNNVRATVCAVSGTNTSVVYLNVHAFRVVVGGINRANGLTWRVVTVLTHDRDEPSFSVREVAFPVSFNTNPGNRSSPLDTVLGVDRNIVFCLTCDYACVATDALVDIDNHSPLMGSEFCCCHWATAFRHWSCILLMVARLLAFTEELFLVFVVVGFLHIVRSFAYTNY